MFRKASIGLGCGGIKAAEMKFALSGVNRDEVVCFGLPPLEMMQYPLFWFYLNIQRPKKFWEICPKYHITNLFNHNDDSGSRVSPTLKCHVDMIYLPSFSKLHQRCFPFGTSASSATLLIITRLKSVTDGGAA